MKIKVGNETIKVPFLEFLIQCCFGDPEWAMNRYLETHERRVKQEAERAQRGVGYAFVRKEFVDACIPLEYRKIRMNNY